MKNSLVSLGIACLTLVFSNPVVANEKNNAISIFRGTVTEDELVFPVPNFENAGQIGLNYNRALKRFNRFGFELDTSLFKYYGDQDHWEINAAFVVRYYIIKNRVSFAVGDGLSFTSDIPELERRRHINTSQILNFVVLDLAYDITPSNSIAVRWHHRSGIWGLINGVAGGSNSVQFGARHKF